MALKGTYETVRQAVQDALHRSLTSYGVKSRASREKSRK